MSDSVAQGLTIVAIFGLGFLAGMGTLMYILSRPVHDDHHDDWKKKP